MKKSTLEQRQREMRNRLLKEIRIARSVLAGPRLPNAEAVHNAAPYRRPAMDLWAIVEELWATKACLEAELETLRRKINVLWDDLGMLERNRHSAAAAGLPASYINIALSIAKVPKPICELSYAGTLVPERSGIYFFWVDGAVTYVGQSENLNRRCRLTHERAEVGDWVSWLSIKVEDLDWVESIYIGALRPPRNSRGVRRASLRAYNQLLPANINGRRGVDGLDDDDTR